MTQLRRMMLEELQRRNYSEITTRKYLQVVTNFAKPFGKSPDKLGPNHLRTYQAYLLQERKLASGCEKGDILPKPQRQKQLRDGPGAQGAVSP